MNKLKNKILIIVIILCILLAIGIIIFLKIKEKQDTEDSIKYIGKSEKGFRKINKKIRISQAEKENVHKRMEGKE